MSDKEFGFFVIYFSLLGWIGLMILGRLFVIANHLKAIRETPHEDK